MNCQKITQQNFGKMSLDLIKISRLQYNRLKIRMSFDIDKNMMTAHQ